MKIGDLDTAGRPILIAEIGNNHEGDRERAMALVDSALESGVDAVKIQIIDPARLVNISQQERIAQLSRFALPMETMAEMAARTRKGGALFLASAFDLDSLARIAPLCDAIKLASGDLDFHPLLAAAARLGKPVLMSTGMATLAEIRAAVDVIERNLPQRDELPARLALLHCVSLYPTQPGQANLRGMQLLSETFSLTTGYSDHTLGIEVALIALGLGARIVEKHFTLDKTRAGFRDHALSADPADMRRLAQAVRSFAEILGDGEKDDRIADRGMAAVARRSIVAIRDLPAGTRLRAEDFDFVRPGTGIPPSRLAEVTGKLLNKPLARHAMLDWGDLS